MYAARDANAITTFHLGEVGAEPNLTAPDYTKVATVATATPALVFLRFFVLAPDIRGGVGPVGGSRPRYRR